MAYSHKSSLQRVNALLRSDENALAAVQGNPDVRAAGEAMLKALSDFATATGVALPAGATITPEKWFPASKAFWCGELPIIQGRSDTTVPTGTFTTKEAAEEFRRQAHLFRAAVGSTVTTYLSADG